MPSSSPDRSTSESAFTEQTTMQAYSASTQKATESASPFLSDLHNNTAQQIIPDSGVQMPRKTSSALPETFPYMFGPYDLLSEVARGGMGVVYRANQRKLNRIVALKMILEKQFESEDARQRFEREAKASANLDHGNIVPVYDFGECEGRLYLAMAFIEGCSLKEHVKKRGALSPQEAVPLFMQIVDALAHAHKRALIHRDLKPENVLLDNEPRARVTDFGLAKRIDENTGMTVTGQIMGTPAYMSPEQARGLKELTLASDVYSLGGILYFMLTGRPPFLGETVTDLLIKVATEAPTPLRNLNVQVPVDLEQVCLKCLNKEPEQRYANADELLQALRSLNSVDTTLIHPSNNLSNKGPGFHPVSFSSTDISIKSTELDRGTIPPMSGSSAQVEKPGFPWLGLIPLIGIIVVGIVVGLLVFGNKETPSTSGGMTSAPETPPEKTTAKEKEGSPKLTKAGKSELANKQVPIVQVQPKDVAWPEPVRKDFKADIEFVQAAAGQDGIVPIPNDTTQQIRLKSDKDAWFVIWSLNADETVVQIFPNQHRQDNRLKAGELRLFPEAADEYDLRFEGNGTVERLRVLMSSKPINLIRAEKIGPFDFFQKKEDCEKLQQLRGATVEDRQANVLVTELDLKFRTVLNGSK